MVTFTPGHAIKEPRHLLPEHDCSLAIAIHPLPSGRTPPFYQKSGQVYHRVGRGADWRVEGMPPTIGRMMTTPPLTIRIDLDRP
ncbi:MAG TPA: hypothetical protein VFU43_00970 [Streptosporangiaceae bacterium]|nr:hypothetical protein [Streptosporangiaceae bacterium]